MRTLCANRHVEGTICIMPTRRRGREMRLVARFHLERAHGILFRPSPGLRRGREPFACTESSFLPGAIATLAAPGSTNFST